MKVVIVGGVAGGATAATRIRRLDENAQIIVIERTGYISYANCGLPYYIGGVIKDKDDLTLQTPESFLERFQIDVRVEQEVTGIDVSKKTVTIKRLDNGQEYEESYDKLILSPGARPVRPDLPGINDNRVFFLRTVEDTFKIRAFVENTKPETAVMIGGGFIGLEIAENLIDLGVKVTIIQRPDHVMNTLDYDMASLVHAKLRSKGIDLKLGSNVIGFESNVDKLSVLLKDDELVRTDMVLMAVGVTPETTLAKKAGLSLGLKNAIVVNDKMETSAADIYAVGDAVMVKHYVTGNDAVIALAGPANKQGRIAADNICGFESHYKGSMGSSVLKLFDMTVASTGITEKTAKQAGVIYDKVVLSPSSHAGYYPGAKVMTMKLIYAKEDLHILGAQIVGFDGVDKRIDVIATAIQAGMRADALKDLDLSYAPPYSSAKDPVNMAGFMIENIETGKIKQFHFDEVDMLLENDNVTLLDVRTEFEYRLSHVEGFINIPVDDLRERIGEIEPEKPVYIMCQSGLRSYIACRILMQNGFDCYNFSGGYRFYNSIVSEKAAAERAYPCGMDK
ncbi:MAG: FAD-dependent oxidoreductase [Lachnospira sp.]